jgi:hypothetical protein
VDEQEVFAFLEKQRKAVLLDFLRAAFEEMTAKQRRAVFAHAVRRSVKSAVNAEQLREEIDQFRLLPRRCRPRPGAEAARRRAGRRDGPAPYSE